MQYKQHTNSEEIIQVLVQKVYIQMKLGVTYLLFVLSLCKAMCLVMN